MGGRHVAPRLRILDREDVHDKINVSIVSGVMQNRTAYRAVTRGATSFWRDNNYIATAVADPEAE